MTPNAAWLSSQTVKCAGVPTKVKIGPWNLRSPYPFPCTCKRNRKQQSLLRWTVCSGEVGFGFSASRSNGVAVFLVPCGSARRVETFLKDRVFERYLVRNHKAISSRYSSEYDTHTIYIIEGTTHTSSWCRGMARQSCQAVRGFVAVDPSPGLPQFRVAGARGESIIDFVRGISYTHTSQY